MADGGMMTTATTSTTAWMNVKNYDPEEVLLFLHHKSLTPLKSGNIMKIKIHIRISRRVGDEICIQTR